MRLWEDFVDGDEALELLDQRFHGFLLVPEGGDRVEHLAEYL